MFITKGNYRKMQKDGSSFIAYFSLPSDSEPTLITIAKVLDTDSSLINEAIVFEKKGKDFVFVNALVEQ